MYKHVENIRTNQCA
uniref:Uncharacterized protein n=1 Tax=Arundo donax TaxID=35708 RepID=A0A0A9AM60_ARUDO